MKHWVEELLVRPSVALAELAISLLLGTVKVTPSALQMPAACMSAIMLGPSRVKSTRIFPNCPQTVLQHLQVA